MKRFTRVAVGLAVGFGTTLALSLTSGSAQAADENCKTVTQNMVRPDSGVAGTWATDTFVRDVSVCVVQPKAAALVAVSTATFTIKGKDVGTFKTQGVTSPMGNAMLPNVHGTFLGSFEATYTAPFDPANPTVWPFWNPTGSNADSTTPWVNKLWSEGHKGGLTQWGWDYTTCNEKWTNAQSGNSGDITGLKLSGIKDCLVVTHVVNCDGKVDVKITNNIADGLKVRVNGVEKTLTFGVNTFVGVTTTDGWVRVKFLDKVIAELRCIKPTVCASPTPSMTPSATPSATPSTSPTGVPASTTPAPPAAPQDGGSGRLALTGAGGGNPLPMLMTIGLMCIFVGAGIFGFLAYQKRKQVTAE